MYGVYQNHDAAVYLFLYFHFALSSMFRLQMTIFITLFSVTMKPKELKLGIQLDSGLMYHVYRSHDAAAY